MHRAVWCAHEAGASCICPDVWQEKERLQEGKKKFLQTNLSIN